MNFSDHYFLLIITNIEFLSYIDNLNLLTLSKILLKILLTLQYKDEQN